MDERRARWWFLGGLAAYVGLGPLSILLTAWVVEPVLTGLGVDTEAGTPGRSLFLAAWPIGWGATTLATATALAARLAIPLSWSPAVVPRLAAAFGVAALVQFADAEWIRSRFGVYDPEYAGLTLFVPAALVAVGCASWAGAVGPPAARRPAAVALGGATVGLLVLVASNAPGAANGIRPESLGLIVSLAAAAVCALALGVPVAARLVATSQPR